MPNATTQAIILKDFTGGIWLNEGEPPSFKYAPYLLNLDPLPGGGYQKREPVRRLYLPLNASGGATTSNQFVFSTNSPGSMAQWLFTDPTNGGRFIMVETASSTTRLCQYDVGTSTAVANTTSIGGVPKTIDFASSDAGASWYVHHGSAADPRRVLHSTMVVTALTTTFNNDVTAPTNGNMPRSDCGVQHLSAYYFVGRTNESSTDYPNRIRWSHPGRFEDYRTNDKLDVGDASPIIALYSVNDTLLIVKDTSIWVLTGYDPDTFQLRKIVDLTYRAADSAATRAAGCSHAQHGAFIAVSGYSVLRWDGNKLTDIGGGIRSAVEDGRFIARNMSVIGDTLYVNSGPTSGSGTADATTDVSWQYNIRTEAWTRHTAGFRGLVANQQKQSGNATAVAVHQNGTAAGYSFSYYRQRVAAGSWCDNWTGSDVDIVCEYRSPWQDARNPARKKRWRRPFFVFNKRPNASASDPATYTMTVYKDWDGVHSAKSATFSATKATDTTDYDTNFGYGHASTGSDFDEPGRLSALGNAYAVQIHLSSTGTPKDQWGFDSLTFKYVPRSLK